jgi:hypothetical protein
MFFLFSGEGPTDLGGCSNPIDYCQGEEYRYGPMTVVVDQIVFALHQYSLLELSAYGFVPKGTLMARASELKVVKKSLRLPGAKTPKETRYFFNNARVLSRIALELQTELDDEVVAVFFRDSDGTQSADRGLWEHKVNSMLNGFSEEGFLRGVPMIPKPKSEAWILCAMKYGYQGCNDLEERSGNDKSPNSLKNELEEHSGSYLSGADLVALLENRTIDIEQLMMPSFTTFRNRLESVI